MNKISKYTSALPEHITMNLRYNAVMEGNPVVAWDYSILPSTSPF